MSVLEKWLPFRFRRKRADEKTTEAKTAELQRSPEWWWPEPRWPMAAMAQRIREAFDEPFFKEPFGTFGDVDRWFGDFAPVRFAPRVDVTDEEAALKVTAELPGMSNDDLHLALEGGLLTIQGEKRQEEESEERGVYRSERYYGTFSRSIPLPEDVDQEKAEAAFDNGVLTVRFPKRAEAKTAGRRIAIKAN